MVDCIYFCTYFVPVVLLSLDVRTKMPQKYTTDFCEHFLINGKLFFPLFFLVFQGMNYQHRISSCLSSVFLWFIFIKLKCQCQIYWLLVVKWEIINLCFCHASSMAVWMVLSVGPPLWSRLKYLNNYQMDCHEIWFPETSMVPRGWILLTLMILLLFLESHDEVHICGFEWNISTIIGWMKFGSDIHVPWRINYQNVRKAPLETQMWPKLLYMTRRRYCPLY